MIFNYDEMVGILDRDHFNNPDPYTHRKKKTWLGLDLEKAVAYFEVSPDEVLRAMYEIASREKLRGDERRCKSCGMPIHFLDRIPYDRSRKNHFIACPNRKEHRRRK